MKKLFAILCVIALGSCGNGDSDQANEATTVENSENNLESSTVNEDANAISEETIQEGSTKEKLIGNWIDANDPSVTVTITSNKYISYVDGLKNWDNQWDLSSTPEYEPASVDDNGTFLLVYLDAIGDVFYAKEITSITENEIVFSVLSSGGDRQMRTFKRN